MLKTHLELLQNTLDTYTLIPKNSRILVANSGGPDSVYLSFLLYTLGFDISLAHVNYGLRNLDSQKEEELIVAYGDIWKIPTYIHRENPKNRMLDSGESLQQSARKIRYDFFESLISKHKYDRCAIAHHADDQVESILMSLVKGNSDRVIHGIPIQRGPFIRPMVCLHRAEIIQGLTEQKLSYGHDISNDSNDYIRNKIRNQILPILEEINPSARKQILAREVLYAEQKNVLDDELEELSKELEQDFPDGTKELNWEGQKQRFSDQKLKHLLIYVLKKWGWHGYDLWNAVGLLESTSGKMVKGTAGTVHRERMGISFRPNTVLIKNPELVEVSEPTTATEYSLNGWRFKLEFVQVADFTEKQAYYMDADKLRFPLYFKSIRTGDKMQPLGMKNQKKLSDIMIDAKWSQREKDKGTVLCDHEKIVAFINFRVSELVKVEANSKGILKLSFEGA